MKCPCNHTKKNKRMKVSIFNCMVFFLLLGNVILGKCNERAPNIDSTEHKLPVINIPNIDGIQTVKALVRVKPKETNNALTLIDSELRYRPVDESDNRQLWWIIQDYEYHAFAFSNASNTNLWLYYDSSTERLSTVKSDKKTSDDSLLEEYLEKQYFFEFEIFDPELTSSYAIRNLYSKSYLKTANLDSEYSNWRLGIGDFVSDQHSSIYFNLEVFQGYSGGEFVYLPMSETDSHTQTKEDRSLNIEAAHLITTNKSFLSSSYGFLINRLGGENMFKVSFDNLVTESVVGLLHYKATMFNNTFYQKEGSRKPIAGIKVKDNVIYLFNKDNIVSTSFDKEIPIVFGYKNGELIASQNGETKRIGGVPTPTLLNSTDGNKIKLLMQLPYGGISIGYNPSILLFGNDFEGEDHVPIVMTNPYMSVLEDPEKRTTEFDWTAKTYRLRYRDGTIFNEEVQSPFYYNKEEFNAISAKYASDKNCSDRVCYIGGEDFEYYDGWELIAHDFGYDRFGNEKPSPELRIEPYMVLYNRYISKLRVFVYMNNQTIANNLKITLSDGPKTGILEQYKPARLWGSYLQGRALDDPQLSTAEYSKMMRLKSTGRSFYFADFTFSYDPCISKYESNLRITVSKVTQGDLEIVGRTKGGAIPVNSPAISDWLSNSNHYLTGVLNAPYGELNYTLGDINFRNFNQWGQQEWNNTASFVLPGKKVQAWEKKFAQLTSSGFANVATGFETLGIAQIIIGSAKIATALDPTGISGKVAIAAGQLLSSAGLILIGEGFGTVSGAFHLKYKSLSDTPDKNIKVTLPDPQPSVVFSELAAKGTLSIETLVFDDVIITTPGSKYSELAPNDHLEGSKGSYPLYNQSLGAFNLLYQPNIALSIVKQSKDIGGYIRLKNHPYLTVNGGIDYLGGFFMVNYIVTTYDTSGYSTKSNRSKPYLLTNKKISGVKDLPTLLDISELLDKKTLLTNINQYKNSGGDDIENKINDWIEVNLEVEFFGYTGKNSDGTYGVANLSNSYKSRQVSNYEDAVGINEDISSLLINFSDLSFGDSYLGNDIELWGENYLISPTTDNYSGKMNNYCGYDSEKNNPRKLRKKLKQYSAKSKKNFAPKDEKTNLLDPVKEEDILVYPNPSDGIFTIDYLPKKAGKVEFQVYNSKGDLLVEHFDYVSSTRVIKKAKINISNLDHGIYFLIVRYESGESYEKELIKN